MRRLLISIILLLCCSAFGQQNTGGGGQGGGGGSVTSIATTSPITGGTITTTGTIACPTCAIGPGTSIANHTAAFTGTNGVTLGDSGVAENNGNITSQTTTAATGGQPIALGAGATNKNSSVSASGTSPLTMTLNINVGDFVILFVNAGDATPTVGDNGSNTYTKQGSSVNFRAVGTMWTTTATGTATTITITDASNVLAISGATYVNVGSIGTPITPVTGSSTTMSLTDVTTGTSSLVVGCFQFNTATTVTATSGSIVTSSFNGTNTVNTAMLSIPTTVPTGYNLTATTNQGTPVWQGLAVELQTAAAVSQNSPTITLGGTGWSGTASVNELSTIQTVVPNTNNPFSVLNITPAMSITNSGGSFNNSVNGGYLLSNINGASASTETNAIWGPTQCCQITGIFGGVSIPALSTQFQVNGIYGAINNSSTTSYGVGGNFTGRALAASTKTFGLNVIAWDSGFATSQLIAGEFDVSQSSADASGPKALSEGIRIVSNGSHRPASAIYVAGSAGSSDNYLSALTVDMANSGDTAANRMIYLIPPDNLNTTTAIQLRNHTDAADVLEITDAGAITASLYQTLTNCSAVGTAASPSVASCSAAPAGSFSCATNATGATCTVNTTAVTANSQIFVQEDETLGTRLGVTCNTSTNVLPTSRLLNARSAGVSFTINLGTVTTNPACFSYHIIN